MTRSIVLAALLLILAGCGEEAKPVASKPEQDVTATLVKLHAAVATRSPQRVCAFYSAQGRPGCEQTLKVALKGAPAFVVEREADIGRIEVKGDRAKVTEAGSEEDPDSLELVREGGAWKLDAAAPAEALEASPECVRETDDGFGALSRSRDILAPTVAEIVDRLCARGSQIGVLPMLGTLSDQDLTLVAISVVNDMKAEGELTQEQAMTVLR